MQEHANILGAVIVGFPDTIEVGDGTHKWSEDPALDYNYIQDQLKEIAKETKLDLTRVALFGFSQGAKVAGDVASQYPDFLSADLSQTRSAPSHQPGRLEFCVLQH